MKRLLTLLLAFSLAASAAHAALVLEQSTGSQAVVLGPFVDSTNGVDAETALTISAADVRISINGGNIVGKNSGDCTHDELGWYTCTFDATDTATVGRMQVMVHETGALPVYHEFQVVEEAVYGRDFEASSTGLIGTAQTGDAFARLGAPAGASVSADIAVIEGQTDDIGVAGAGLTVLATAAALTTVDNEIATIDTNVSAIETTIGVAGAGLTEAGGTGDQFTAFGAIALQAGNNGAYPGYGIIASGTAQAYTSGTPSVTLAAATAMGDDDPNGGTIWVLGSNEGDWQPATISDYVGSTDVATIDAAFSTAPTGTISYIVFGTAASSGGGLDAAGVRTAIGLASANLDTQLATIDTNVDDIETDTGTTLPATLATIDGIVDAIVLDTAEIGTAGAGLTNINLPNQTMDITGTLSGTVGGIAGTITTLDGLDTAQDTQHSTTQSAITALNDLSTAEVNAQVVDALATDTYAQPGTGAPAATEDLASMIAYLYKSWRNRSTQTATTYTLYNDDGTTAEQAATVSDDATTFVKGEVGAP